MRSNERSRISKRQALGLGAILEGLSGGELDIPEASNAVITELVGNLSSGLKQSYLALRALGLPPGPSSLLCEQSRGNIASTELAESFLESMITTLIETRVFPEQGTTTTASG